MAVRAFMVTVVFALLTMGCGQGPSVNTDEEVPAPSAEQVTPADEQELFAGNAVDSNPNHRDGEETKPAPLRVLSWNVESEGSDPEIIADQLKEFADYDIIALSEVLPSAADQFQKALGKEFDGIVTRSGYNDRLQILFNANRFKLVRRLELDEINDTRHRSPLVAHLHDNLQDQDILVMNNHLARGNAEYRTTQANQLVQWAREQTTPIIAVGDYNFDYVFDDDEGNEGFRAMLMGDVFKWVKPSEWIDTNWYDPEPDGVDNYPGSMLDFAFVAGPATHWQSVCNVIVRPDDFPDDQTTSDHRPFELIITP